MKKRFLEETTLPVRIAVALILTVFTLFFRGLYPRPQSWGILLGSEAALFLLLAAWTWAGSGFLGQRKEKPLFFVLVMTLLDAFLLVIFLACRTWDFLPASRGEAGLAARLIADCWLVLLAATLGLAFSALRGLFYLKKARQPGWSFQAMLTCFAFSFFVPAMAPAAAPFFMGLCVCLMVLNSFRVKWIAFLVKRQKKKLIALAGISLGIFIANAILISNGRNISALVPALSPGIFQLGRIILWYGACYSGVILFATLFHMPTADAYDRKAEEFASLVDLSQSITGMMEFKELAEKVTTATAAVCHSDFSWLLIKQNDEFSVPAAFNIGSREAREIGLALLGETVPDQRSVTVFQDKKLKIRIQNDVLSFAFSSLVMAPLRVKDRTTGYLFMAIKKDLSFENDDILTIEAFANSAAMALENARVLETRLEKERLLKELDVARLIQRRLLPQSVPRVAGADIAVYFAPAYEVGGDYYDFFPAGDRRLGLVIADVSGKGLAAAFVMAEVKGIFESLAGEVTDPGRLLGKANGILRKSLERVRFVSASYAIVDLQEMVLRVARAGHMPFFLNSGDRIESFAPPGLVLGAADEPLFSEKLKETTVRLHGGDRIVFITDGVTEAKNLSGGEFGYERLQSVIQSNRASGADVLAKRIVEEVKAFVNQPMQFDDITLLVIGIG